MQIEIRIDEECKEPKVTAVQQLCLPYMSYRPFLHSSE